MSSFSNLYSWFRPSKEDGDIKPPEPVNPRTEFHFPKKNYYYQDLYETIPVRYKTMSENCPNPTASPEIKTRYFLEKKKIV